MRRARIVQEMPRDLGVDRSTLNLSSNRVARLILPMEQTISKDEERMTASRCEKVAKEIPLDRYRDPLRIYEALTEWYKSLGRGEGLRQMSDEVRKKLFSGILHTITQESDNKYNETEITIFYRTLSNETDPANILFYDDVDVDGPPRHRYGTGPSSSGQYLGIQFNRIEVMPCCYALRSDGFPPTFHTNRLRSFAFQGRKRNQQWETLDERLNIRTLDGPKSCFFSFVDTDQYYTEFRILQTGPSNSNNLSFDLAGFEIHGRVELQAGLGQPQ